MSAGGAFDAGDPAEVESRERRSRDLERELDRALAAILALPEGRRVLWWVVRDLSGWFDRSFTGNSTTFFNEGRRQVGTALVERLMRLDRAAFGSLITEMMEGPR